VQDEQVWRRLLNVYHFDPALHGPCESDADGDDPIALMHSHIPHVLTLPRIPQPTPDLPSAQSSQTLFKHAWLTCMSLIFSHSLPESVDAYATPLGSGQLEAWWPVPARASLSRA
jgi:hypothetical protein